MSGNIHYQIRDCVLSAAYVPYCSSDWFTGTKNASLVTQGFTFHGHYIVRAVIADLLENTWAAQVTHGHTCTVDNSLLHLSTFRPRRWC